MMPIFHGISQLAGATAHTLGLCLTTWHPHSQRSHDILLHETLGDCHTEAAEQLLLTSN